MSKYHKKKNAKPNEGKAPQSRKSNRPKQTPKRNWLSIGLLILAALFGIAYIYSSFMTSKATTNSRRALEDLKNRSAIVEEPKFVKEGEVVFLNNDGSDKIKIDVEIADNEGETQLGLMYRTKMEETHGMLFAFPEMRPQSFWMKNTKISLDIIYVDNEHKIVSIQKNTKPLSEVSLPSTGPAQYVIEVNAGFCDRHDIKAGDKVAF